jgi:CoA:oxalate CoA-transferase
LNALDDLLVLECGTRLSVAVAGKLLAELGARVIKVEPREGDPARLAGPFPDNLPDTDRSALFLYLNRGKESLTLDLRHDAAGEPLRRLLSKADLLLTGDSPWERERLTYEALGAEHPLLVCTSVTPLGLEGPWSGYAATEIVVTALSGVGYFIPGAVDNPGAEPPILPGANIASFVAGVQAANSSLIAVIARDMTQRGQQVDVSEQATLTDTLRMYLANYVYADEETRRERSGRFGGGVQQTWRCADGYVWGMAGRQTDEHGWLSLVGVMGSPEWALQPELLDANYRRDHWDEIWPRLDEWARSKPKAEIADALQACHVISLPVNTPAELLRSEHLKGRGAFVPLDAVRTPGVQVPVNPVRFDGEVCDELAAAPRLGQHTRDVLRWAGYIDEDISRLASSGIV